MSGSTFSEQLQQIANEYLDTHEGVATAREIAAWALENDLWKPTRGALVNQLAEKLARALREEYIVDAQGRTVRAKHAARIAKEGEQLTLWADIRTASHEHLQVAFQQRRQQIVGDCRQLKLDVDSYNDNRNPKRPIQLVLDFTDDIAELEALEAVKA